MCLLLGPPGSGKSSLLKILAGKVKSSKLVQVGPGHALYCDLCSAIVLQSWQQRTPFTSSFTAVHCWSMRRTAVTAFQSTPHEFDS